MSRKCYLVKTVYKTLPCSKCGHVTEDLVVVASAEYPPPSTLDKDVAAFYTGSKSCVECGSERGIEATFTLDGEVFGLCGMVFPDSSLDDKANSIVTGEYVQMCFCLSADAFKPDEGERFNVEYLTGTGNLIEEHLAVGKKRPTILLLKDQARDRYAVYHWKHSDFDEVNAALMRTAQCLICT